MSTTQKNNLLQFISMLVIGLTLFQALIPGMPIRNATTITLISSITMYLVSTLTVWKQNLSNCIDNAAKIPTYIIMAIATIGGLNQLLDLIPISPIAGQWIRFSITAVTAILNMLSSTIYPSK